MNPKRFSVFISCIFLISFALSGQSEQYSSEKIRVEITEPSKGIYLVKSCFGNNYRRYTKNESRINSQWTYQYEQFFGDDGCYQLISRTTPDIEDIKNHITQVTTIKRNQLHVESKI